MPNAHVERDPRKGHANESATGLTKLAARALLDPHLESFFCRRYLHVAGPDAHTGLDSAGDDLAFEDQLREAPVPPVFAHAHDDAARAAPDSFARCLEPAGDQLAKLVRDCLFGGFGRRPFDRLFLIRRWAPDDAEVRPSGFRLLERQAQQL